MHPYYQALAQRQTDMLLGAMPAHYAKLSEVTGLTVMQIKHRTRIMRDANLCHVGGWKRNDGRGKHNPILHAGPGKDVECKLKHLTDKDYSRNYRKRNKNTEQGDLRRAKDRMRHWERKAAAAGDPLVNALFGHTRNTRHGTADSPEVPPA